MPMTQYRRTLSAMLLGASLCGLSSTALAVTDEERAGARAQAVAGADAFQAGRYQEALDRFQRAEAVVHSPVHLVYMAKAQIQLGQLVEAQEKLLAVSRETLPAGAPEQFAKAKEEVEPLLAQLEPRIPQLTVTVQGADPGATKVTMDGKEVPTAFVGVPRPVNPGEHKFEATAPGLTGQASITLAEGERQSVEIQLTAAPGGAETTSTASVGTTPMDQGTQGAPNKNGLRIGSYVTFGVGVVGLGVGTVFALKFSSKKGDADELFNECQPRGCTSDERAEIGDLDKEANSAGTIGTVGFIVGGVGIAAGVTLLVMSLQPGGETATTTGQGPHVSPYFGVDRVGVTGTF